MFGARGAKEGYALDFAIAENPVVWEITWFSFVPDGIHSDSRSFYPPINRWAIFGRPCGASSAAVAFIRAIRVICGQTHVSTLPSSPAVRRCSGGPSARLP